jgi:hypothetical protein
MNILDIFDGTGYKVADLTTAINKLPYVPSRLGASGLFTPKSVSSLVVMVERRKGKISLLPVKPRGSGESTKRPAEKRDIRPFAIPHIPHGDSLMADDIQGVRAFGSADKLETINEKVTDVLAGLRANHEITHEYHRIGAIQGRVLDADGSTEVFDFFTEFNITETEVDFALDDDQTNVKARCEEVIRRIEDQLGGVPHSGVACYCGNGFWDSLIQHPKVERAFEKQMDGAFLCERQIQDGVRRLEFGGITFENYRGSVGSIRFIPHLVARFVPMGVQDLFHHYSAPADYIETVNTMGQPVYVKQERMKFDKGIEFESQSNPAIICTRPEVLIKGTTEAAADVIEEI